MVHSDVIQRQNNFDVQSLVENSDEYYMLIIDIGTTNFKLKVMDQRLSIIQTYDAPMSKFTIKGNEANYDAEKLWNTIVECIKHPNIPKINSISLSCHRNSFLFWDKESGQSITPINTWKDKHAKHTANELNSRFSIKLFQIFSSIKYKLKKNVLDGIKASFRFKCIHVSTRLYAILKNDSKILQSWNQGKLLYGTLDTWIVWKLTNGNVYASGETFACTTGLYNLIQNKYDASLCQFLKIPLNLLPPVVSEFKNAHLSETLIGYSVPIVSVLADQSASLYGVGAYDLYSCKINLGTGVFLSVNTGRNPIPIVKDKCYPIVGWEFNNKKIYAYETYNSNGSGLFEQLKSNGELKDFNEIDLISVSFIEILSSNENSIPPNISQTIYALEHYIFNIFSCWINMKNYIEKKMDMIRVDGRISKCKFILQYLSNLTKCQIRRYNPDSTSFGLAMITGRKLGILNEETINEAIFADSNDVFLPQNDTICKYCHNRYLMWKNNEE